MVAEQPKPNPTTPKRRRKPAAAKAPVAPATLRNKHGEVKKGRALNGRQLDKVRTAEVQDLKEMLFPEPEIKNIISKKYGVTKKTVHADLARIEAAWQEESRGRTVEKSVQQANRTAMRMFRRCVGKGEDKTAHKFFQDWCRIVGAYAPDALKLTGAEAIAFGKLDKKQLDAEIADELARAMVDLSPDPRAELLAAVSAACR